MRPTALIPVLCCIAALILSFLCLFAGHKQGFMEDYHLITLNTSAIGETLLNESTSDSSSSNPIFNLLDEIPDRITSEINDRLGDVAERLGIEDFYSAHMLNYCFGQYTPLESANETVSQSDISKNVTGCSERRAMYKFDPTAIVEEALNKTTGLDITLQDLRWPDDIQSGIDALNALMGAMFVLYVVAIALIFVTLLSSIAAIILSGRLSACLNFLVAILAFVAIGLASALTTAVMVKGSEVVNQYGNEVGVEAYWGSKFLGLTWAATGLMLVVVVMWVVEVCVGRRKNKRANATYTKHG